MTLRELASNGWITFEGVRNHVETWKAAEQGNRLAVTRLIKRFPVTEGKAVLDKIVAKARELNTDPHSSRRIAAITLFGSVLTAPDDADAGDIDIIVSLHRRNLSKKDIARLEKDEEKRAPEGRWSMWNDQRERELLRAIKKVSHRIALHSESDLDVLQPAHQVIYRYEIGEEREIPASEPVAAGKRIVESNRDQQQATPDLPFQGWPHAPNFAESADHTDLETLLHCQHFWIRGETLEDIARRTRFFPETSCLSYLSSLQEHSDRLPGQLFPSFRNTVLNAGLRSMTNVTIERWPGQSPHADVTSYEEGTYKRRAWVRRVARYEANFRGEAHQFPSLDAVSFAAWHYARRLASSAPQLGFRISASHFGEASGSSALQGSLPRLTSFVEPMLAILHEQRRRAGKTWDAYRERIAIDFNAQAPVQRVTRADFGWPYSGRRILKRDALAVWPLIADAKIKYPFLGSFDEHFMIFVHDSKKQS